MPNRRANRRKRNRHRPKNSKPKPSDIDKMIQELSASQTHPAMLKFLTYIMERKVYGPDCSNEFVIFCLSSYFTLKNKYPTFSIMFDLPPREFLEEEALKEFNFSPGIQSNVLELLKIKTENYESLAKICILVIEEITLKPEVKYCHKHNHTVGLEDNGKIKSNLPANFVTNIWIHCVGGQWLMPFAYYFTNTSCSANLLKDYLFEAITKLDAISLDVIGVVTKMRSNFYELSQILNISPINQLFKVENKEIVFLFDVPQLMNITRNNMMKYKFKFEEKYTSWKYVKQFFINDNQHECKTKLTIAHIKPDKNQRSCPKLAIELLSNCVASEMKSDISLGKLPESATGTAEYIELFDKLFDVLNSSNEISMNEYCNAYKGNKHQVKFLEKMINFLENLKVYDSSDQDCSSQVKFINGWLISIKGVMKMWDILKRKNYPYLLTRNINCESLDKFVWLLRWQLITFKDPTPTSFFEIFSSFFTSSYFEEQPVATDFDILDYTKKVFKRIPPVRHDMTGKTKMSDSVQGVDQSHQNEESQQGCSSGGHSDMDIFGDFMKNFLDLVDFD